MTFTTTDPNEAGLGGELVGQPTDAPQLLVGVDLAKEPALHAIFLAARGYERLADVLAAAFAQASTGKGKERHANALPFHEQPMQTIARDHGIGFITGQARKKAEEALGMMERGHADAAIKELLGAIVYTAGAVIFIQDRQG